MYVTITDLAISLVLTTLSLIHQVYGILLVGMALYTQAVEDNEATILDLSLAFKERYNEQQG